MIEARLRLHFEQVNGSPAFSLNRGPGTQRKFSVLFPFELRPTPNSPPVYLLSKTRLNRSKRTLDKALSDPTQIRFLRNEHYNLLQACDIFSEANGLRVPEVIARFDDLNTLVLSRAPGEAFSAYLNRFEFHPRLKPPELARLCQRVQRIAHWLSRYHQFSMFSPQSIDAHTLIDQYIFRGDKIARLAEFLPEKQLLYWHRAIVQAAGRGSYHLPKAHLHGDFKPRHIFFDEFDTITVIDFGNGNFITPQFIYEDLAGFIGEIVLLDYGMNLNKTNHLARTIEEMFLETYAHTYDSRLLNFFVFKYLLKKWAHRRRRLRRFAKRYFGRPHIFLLSQIAAGYIDHYFRKKIAARLE